MEKQAGQSLQQPSNPKNDKKIIRFAPGSLRNSSSNFQISVKNTQPLPEQSAGSVNSALSNNFPVSCPKPSIQMGDPQNLTASSSTTQTGFFRRKMHLKMSTTGFKIFNTKLQLENAPALTFKKARLTSNHLSQGNPFLQGNSPQQQFSSQSIQPILGNQPSVTSSQSPFGLQITNSRNETHSIHSSISTWMGNHRPSVPSSELNSNQLSRGIRSSGYIGACQRSKTAASSVRNEDKIEKETGQQQQINNKQDTNEEFKEESNTNQSQKYKKSALRNPSLDKNADQDSSCLEESQANYQGSSLQTPMENYSHNTESTNVTTAQSNSVSQHAFFDGANLKVKQRLSGTQINVQLGHEIQAKKKIIEAKQFSNQVRQQIFEMQNQDEEDNFLELCETLQKITKN